MAKAKRKSHSYDYEKAQKQLDRVNASMESNFSWWKASQGDNDIRVLPPISQDADLPYQEVFLHYGLDDVPITCLGSKCPICQFIKQSGKSKQFKQIRKSRRLFFQIIDRDMDVPEPMIWSAGSKFLQYFLPIFLDIDEYGDITDIEEGTDLVVNRVGEGLKTTYTFRIKRHPSPVSEDDDEIDEILEDMIDLSSISQRLSVDEVDDLLHDYLSDKDIDGDFFDEDDEPSQRRKRKRKKRKREVEEEEDEEEEEVEDKPKSNSRKKGSGSKSSSKEKTSRKPRSTKTESEDDGGEEEEPDEDEVEPEEDEAPKKKPRKKKQIDPEEEEDEEEVPEKKKPKSKSSSSNDNTIDDLLKALDGELADLVDDDNEDE